MKPTEAPSERWKADFRAALTGILANPATNLDNTAVNVRRAVNYADACLKMHEELRDQE